MPLITKPNYNQIFASQAPDVDKPAVFNNYPEGWGPESRPNNGKPTIKGFNYLQQTSDLKDLWILQNGACLPYDESIEYAEGAVVAKDGVLQQWKGGEWVSVGARKASDITDASGKTQQEINDLTGAPYRVRVGGYNIGERVILENGDIVQSVVTGNTVDPNLNMTGWVNPRELQQQINNTLFSRVIHIKDFGAIGDGASHPLSERFTTLSEAQQVYPFATSLAEEIDVCAFQKMVNTHPSNTTLHIGGLNLYFGEIQHAKPKVLIDSPENLVLHGVCNITCIAIEKRVVAIAVKNPRKFRAYDFYFKDPNFDIATQGGQYYGVLGIAFYADTTYSNSNPCGDIVVTGGADQMLAFVATEGAQVLHLQDFYNLNAIDDVEITATLKNCYYGLHSTYGSTNNKIRLLCYNVKRALNSYGMNGIDAFITLKCDAGFVGSDAFFELACEGGEFPDVSDVKAVIHVTGVEAHTAYATLYHQKPAQYGTIKNIDIEVWTKDLTTTGKNPVVEATNLIRMTHHNGLAVQQTTERFFDSIKLNTFIEGEISGAPLKLESYPNNKSGKLTLGESLCNAMPQTGAFLTYWTWFDIQKANIRYVFEPAVVGATSAGTATYQRRFGVLEIKDKQATVNYDVQWTDHTGTGFIAVQRVPIIAINATNGLPPVALRESGFTGVVSGVLDGAKDVQLYSKDAATGSVVRANVQLSGVIRANFNFTVAKP